MTGEPRPVVSPDTLDRMTDAMIHRGPDDRGTHTEPGVALGVRRLSIVDVEGGHQPVSNETGEIWAVQNGELYNHADLRRLLRADGHPFRSRCDTEVLPHLYERHGVRFPVELRGKFCLALWDRTRRRAVIARDRLGVKPLYYVRVGELLVFASELKSVLASGLVSGELDYDALDMYLTFGFVPGPATLLSGVAKLTAGHLLVVEEGSVRDEEYWRYPEPRVERRLTVDEYSSGLIDQLDDAVRARLMSDVPLGAMLSGGLDSSLVVALMARHMHEPVKTFSVGFAEVGRFNELPEARRVAAEFGADHHELELSFLEDTVNLDTLVWHLDEPLADISALGFLALSELARTQVTVALSGQGADELLGGYKKHRAAVLVRQWNHLPRALRVPASAVAGRLPGRLARAGSTLAAPDAASRLVAMSGHVDDRLRTMLYRGPLSAVDGRASLRAVRSLVPLADADPLSTTLHIDAQLALVDSMLLYFDRASMAHSLEVRVPFLDHHVVEYCARIPSGLKVHHLTTKYVLKRAARGIVPDRVIERRKLGFFRPAFDGWFRAQMERAAAVHLLGPTPAFASILDADWVRATAAAHLRNERPADVYLLVGILMLEIWLSTYLPRALTPPHVDPVRDRICVPG